MKAALLDAVLYALAFAIAAALFVGIAEVVNRLSGKPVFSQLRGRTGCLIFCLASQ